MHKASFIFLWICILILACLMSRQHARMSQLNAFLCNMEQHVDAMQMKQNAQEHQLNIVVSDVEQLQYYNYRR